MVHPIVLLIIVMTFVGFNLYVSDLVQKMKEDMRVVKIRTGKIIHLLDGVLNKTAPEAGVAQGFVDGDEQPALAAAQPETQTETLAAPVSTAQQVTQALTGFFTSPAASAQSAGTAGTDQAPDDDTDIDAILRRLKSTIPKFA